MIVRHVDDGITSLSRRIGGSDWNPGRPRQRIPVTVSGSLRRHLEQVDRAMAEFTTLGSTVLSPTSGQIHSIHQGFTELGGDPSVVPWITEGRHLEAIAASSLLWVVAPDGPPGPSTTMEIGYALAEQVPVFSARSLWDEPLRHFIRFASTPERALEQVRSSGRRPAPTLLLNPGVALDRMRNLLDELELLLRWERGPMSAQESQKATAAALKIKTLLEALGNLVH
jgi:hypothetical protein